MTIANMIDEQLSDDDDGPVSDEDTERFLTELLAAAGPVGLTPDQIGRAYDQFTDWSVTAAMILLWDRRQVTLSWDPARQDLVMHSAA